MGDIRFNQDYDNLSEVVEAVKLDAKVKDLMGSATAIRVFSDDPMTMPEQEELICLGSWFNAKKGEIKFKNQYHNEISLGGENSLEGKYIGIISLDDGHLCGCCEIQVEEVPDEPESEDSESEDEDEEEDEAPIDQ